VDPRLSVDSQGHVQPADGAAAQLLQERRGDWSLAATSPDWMVWLKQPVSGGVLDVRPRVVLAGDPGLFPLSDLIAFLGQSRWTGVLRLVVPGADRTLALKDGEVRWASSDAPTDRIGEVMVRLGYVTRTKLEEVLRDTPPSRVGRALVERGLMQAHDLWKVVTEQASEIFHAMMLAKEGAFFLLDQDLGDQAVHSLNLSMQSLLMDSIRKIDEMAHFRKRIPHARLYVVKKRGSDGKLEPEEDQVLALVDGARTVGELAQHARLNEFDITRVVYRLLEGGFVSVGQHPSATAASVPVQPATPSAPRPPVTPGALDERKVLNIFNFIFREVRNEVSRHGKLETFMQAANAGLASGSLSPSPLLNGLNFQPDGSLPEAVVLAAYAQLSPSLGTEPLASFRQALSDVMFFLLFQAGELLEKSADEELARRVKELLSTLDAQ